MISAGLIRTLLLLLVISKAKQSKKNRRLVLFFHLFPHAGKLSFRLTSSSMSM
jgi:hypothetical protein